VTHWLSRRAREIRSNVKKPRPAPIRQNRNASWPGA